MTKLSNPVLPPQEGKPKTLRCIVCTHLFDWHPYVDREETGPTCKASCELILHQCYECSGVYPSEWIETPLGKRKVHHDCKAVYERKHPQGDPNDTCI